MARNWVKVYDKASVLRVETTINNPREFRILRVQDTLEGRQRRSCQMRKGVADTWRYFQVGTGANRRYLDALATAAPNGEGIAALDALCRPHTNRGRHVAAFRHLRATRKSWGRIRYCPNRARPVGGGRAAQNAVHPRAADRRPPMTGWRYDRCADRCPASSAPR
jgi:hypothetical protein